MDGERMQTCKAALKLFIQSLPVGSKFTIISFGSSYALMEIKKKYIIDYNDFNKKKALELIDKMTATMGGTEILKPLKRAQTIELPEGYAEYIQWLKDMKNLPANEFSSDKEPPLPSKHI